MQTTQTSRTVHIPNLGSMIVTTRSQPMRHDARSSKGRIYVTCPDPAELGLGSAPRTHISDDGGPIDKAWKAYNRTETDLMRMWIGEALHVEKLRFSRRAGCSSCPCSPGFITDDPAFRHRTVRVEVKHAGQTFGHRS